MDDHLHLDNAESSEFTDQEFRKFLTGRQGENVNRPYTYQVGSVFQCPVWVDLGDQSLTDITSNLLIRGLDSDIPIQLQLRISLQCLFAPLIIIAVCVFLGVVILSLLCFCIKKKRVPGVLHSAVIQNNFNRKDKHRQIHYHERPKFNEIPPIDPQPTIQNISRVKSQTKSKREKATQPYHLNQMHSVAEQRNESNSTTNSQKILFPTNNVTVVRSKSGRLDPLFGQPAPKSLRNERSHAIHEPSTSIGTHRISRNFQKFSHSHIPPLENPGGRIKSNRSKPTTTTRKYVQKDIISFI